MRPGNGWKARTENAHPCRMRNIVPAVKLPSAPSIFPDHRGTRYSVHVYRIPTMCRDMKPGSTSFHLCSLERFSNLPLPYL